MNNFLLIEHIKDVFLVRKISSKGFLFNTRLVSNCVICFFADERDRVQKKTFTKWVNKHLIKVRPSPELSCQCT